MDKIRLFLKEGLIIITKYLEGENLKESEKKKLIEIQETGLVDNFFDDKFNKIEDLEDYENCFVGFEIFVESRMSLM
jgi:hypothetical protein